MKGVQENTKIVEQEVTQQELKIDIMMEATNELKVHSKKTAEEINEVKRAHVETNS